MSARSRGGRVLLRIEDVDVGRARADVADGQRRDLEWLGLTWDEEVPAQATRHYGPWLQLLQETYRCMCTRRQLGARAYAGACRGAGHTAGTVRWRLPPGPVRFADTHLGPRCVDPSQRFGDPILVRADGVATYPLAVVVDDLTDGVTEVVRGGDLLEHTATQILLWEAFGATPPVFTHVPMILGPDGRKLSKSHGSTDVASLRNRGIDARAVWAALLPLLGLQGDDLATAPWAVSAWTPTPWQWLGDWTFRRLPTASDLV